MKISPVEAQLFHADTHKDGRTDRQTGKHYETNSRFSQFCEKRLKTFPFREQVTVGSYFSAVENFSHRCKQLPKERTFKLH